MVLHREVWLPARIEVVFEFFSDAANLQLMTPPWLHFRVLTPRAPIEQGSIIDYRLRLHGIPIRWQSEITVWEPPRRFVDEQRRGPYRRWVHTHTFATRDDGTVVSDDVDFEVPFAFVSARFVERDVKRVFDYRREVLERLFGGATDRSRD